MADNLAWVDAAIETARNASALFGTTPGRAFTYDEWMRSRGNYVRPWGESETPTWFMADPGDDAGSRPFHADILEGLEYRAAALVLPDQYGRLRFGSNPAGVNQPLSPASGTVTINGVEWERSGQDPREIAAQHPAYAALFASLPSELLGFYHPTEGYLMPLPIAQALNQTYVSEVRDTSSFWAVVSNWLVRAPIFAGMAVAGAALGGAFPGIDAATGASIPAGQTGILNQLFTQPPAPVSELRPTLPAPLELPLVTAQAPGPVFDVPPIFDADVVVSPYVDAGPVTGIPLEPWAPGMPAWPTGEQLGLGPPLSAAEFDAARMARIWSEGAAEEARMARVWAMETPANVVVSPYVDAGPVTGIPLEPWAPGMPAWPTGEQLGLGPPLSAAELDAARMARIWGEGAADEARMARVWAADAAPIVDPFVDIAPLPAETLADVWQNYINAPPLHSDPLPLPADAIVDPFVDIAPPADELARMQRHWALDAAREAAALPTVPAVPGVTPTVPGVDVLAGLAATIAKGLIAPLVALVARVITSEAAENEMQNAQNPAIVAPAPGVPVSTVVTAATGSALLVAALAAGAFVVTRKVYR